MPIETGIVDDADGHILIVEASLLPLAAAVTGLTGRIRRVIVIGEAVPGKPGQEAFAASS